ncbi:cytochrome p450 [Colletotrichum kahawae]|uniref:Cytochrome p450 n=1 Tax=Colletotrichum kahawae TaxID=34407 RepID=A0AAD9YNX4_COLKA|nr:cytochrome p450 [Colletotrichum kahawae]
MAPFTVSFAGIILALAQLCFCLLGVKLVYNIFFHPLAKYPGPLLMRASRIPFLQKHITGTLSFEVLDLHKKYGDVVRVAPNELAFADARAWKDIMGIRRGRPEMEKWDKFYRPIPGMATNIVNSGREEHGLLRRQLAHGFSDQSMHKQQPLIKKYVDLLIHRLYENGPRQGKAVNMAAWYNFTTFDIISDLAFGEPFGCLDNSDYHPWVRSIFETTRMGIILQSSSHYPLFQKMLLSLVPEKAKIESRKNSEFTKAKLMKRMEQGADRPDLIEGLLKKRGEWDMDMGRLESNSSILITGGSETTATLLSGVTYHLLTNPAAFETLNTEIRSAFQTEDEIDFRAVGELKYLSACLDEGLRMYPSVPFGMPRLVPAGGAMVAGSFVPEGNAVAVHQWAMYHNDKHFRDPFSYRPERWLGDPYFVGDNKDAFQPFHLGTRNCIGRNLAYVEMRLILARILWNFDMELASDSADWLTKQKIFILWEKGPLNVHLTPVKRS